MGKLDGKVAVITGSGRGIGKAAARAAAAAMAQAVAFLIMAQSYNGSLPLARAAVWRVNVPSFARIWPWRWNGTA